MAIAVLVGVTARGFAATPILYDRVLPLSHIEMHAGSPTAPPVTRAQWTQMLFELSRAATAKPTWPSHTELRARPTDPVLIPIAILDFDYLRTPEGAPQPATHRAFAATALRQHTHRGGDIAFDFDRARYATNRTGSAPRALAADFDDGRGWRHVDWGTRPHVRYTTLGRKIIRVRMEDTSGATLYGSFPFDVLHLGTPPPDDTLQVTATVPYLGAPGTGNAYIYLAPGNATLTNPIVMIEGFDLDNSLGWDEIYQLLNTEGLIETLRAQGFDAVVLDFTDATTYIQRNALLAATLIEQVQTMIAPAADMVVVGASMGGLVGRYALAHLEAQGTPARVRNFITFDTPHQGANIPLGIQYWVQFFADQSAEAATLRDLLNTPAARQMLVYHFTDPPSTTAAADPLRAQLLADFATLGDYPSATRRVAIANGSGAGLGQTFAAAEQIVRYEYTSFLVDLTGNVWAVPDGGSATIFHGIVDYFFPPPDEVMMVTVSGTQPYDNAPGGTRSSMADMDATPAPYGDIVALHNDHCFIPTTSALDVNAAALFENLSTDPNLAARTPFDAVYFPLVNQGHVAITPENAAWLLAEIPPPPPSDTAAGPVPPALHLHANIPNPFNPTTTITFEVPHAGPVEIEIHDVRGRAIAVLDRRDRPAGRHTILWDGRTGDGAPAASGTYLCTLRTSAGQVTRRMTLVR
jgi:hypothetical protein